ncbi:hypothetical protein FKM82_005060 [Ascaphus truei]
MREVLVDPERRRHVFLESHLAESGHHLGQKKTVHRIQRGYYWLGIVKDVIEWIKLCETCQSAEHQKNLSRKWKPLKVEHPWQALGMELHGPFPQTSRENSYVLTVTDCFTMWIEAVPLPRNDAVSVAKALTAIFYRSCILHKQNINLFQVLANISAAGKERRKSVPRPLGPPPARFKVQDEMFGSESDQPLKKFKHNHIMSFKFETVLSPEEMIPAVEKTS